MIDETLYKLATDELNSDQRKPDIWARACALASNDHDEARYLYANLRVEQMLAVQAKRNMDLARSGGVPSDDITPERHDETQLDKTAPIESTRSGQTSDLNLLAEGLELEGESLHSSVSGNQDGLELSLDDFDLDPEEVANMNAAEPGTTSSIHGNVTKANTPPGQKNAISIEDDPLAYWAQQHQAQRQISGDNDKQRPPDNDTERNKELERQADELPGQQSKIVSVESSAAVFQPKPKDTARIKPGHSMPDPIEPVEPQTETQVEQALEPQRESAPAESPVHFDYADDDNSSADDIINAPTLRPGSGKRYYVYSRHGKTHAVKDGVSWPAMLLTLPWLLAKGMLGTGIVYVMLWLIVVAGLLTSGFAWMDAAPNTNNVIKVWTLLFALLAVIGLFYLPFRHGNKWFQKKLIDRGYELDALVHAKNRKEAINASFDSAAF
ncbi:MAG: hypothetical protein V3U65_17410 [Granulosicoccaceae bacterium]